MSNLNDKDFAWNFTKSDSIEGIIMFLEMNGSGLTTGYPIKLDAVIAIICTRGTIYGSLNLRPFEANAPGLLIILSDQVLQIDRYSEEFHGKALVLSNEFWKDFSFSKNLSIPIFSSISENPFIKLEMEELYSIMDYFKLLQTTIRKKENQNRSEAVKYLTMAFFYGIGYQFHKIPDDISKTKHDIITEKFLTMVRDNFRYHRDIRFYAEKLSLTPKYLSKVLRQKSGKTAAEWIDDHIILEAKALMMSTNKNIKQISDELNFPSQSFFGKYFKRRVGISPKEYRKNR
ncbi:MAG: AraC family transcriptional regulator [Bacteroidales bacterium]|nr:AraC family transcriptional regulator [Bacteroidales bacterium]